MAHPFRVGLSHDFTSEAESTSWGDIGLAALTAAGVDVDVLPRDDGTLTSQHVEGYDAVLFAAPSITSETVTGDRPPMLLARFGVGLDQVDLQACTAAGVAVTITPDGARRAVATAALTLILAVGHNLLPKDRLVRACRWEDKVGLRGRGLTGRRVGTVGLGNVALELFELLAPFKTENLAADPFRTAQQAAEHGVRLVQLDQLFRECDVIVVTASLTKDTYHAINRHRLSLMPSHAIIVNVARGPIVDTDALVDALRNGDIAGAGLDVVDPEPLPVGHPLLSMSNVVLSPHALAWTDEMALGNGRSAIRAILDVRNGRAPEHLANPDVLVRPSFRARIETIDR